MTWHDQFTEAGQADWLESVDTIAYSKSWVEAISHWDFNGKCHGGFVPRKERREKAITACGLYLLNGGGEG